MKPDTINKATFRTHKSVSPEEIFAAGGTTAFGRKKGNDNAKIIERMKSLPEDEQFTDEEWEETLKQLRDSK